MRLYMGLLHYPVFNKHHERIASAITTFDLHDLSRLARTYGVSRFFIITPLKDQQELAQRVIRHWTIGYGASYNFTRKEAFESVTITSTLAHSVQEIIEREREEPLLVATGAGRQNDKCLGYPRALELIRSNRLIFLLFGTGWGLDKEVFEEADYVLDPIEAGTDYNHLSVRSAAAIILDRLAGIYTRG